MSIPQPEIKRAYLRQVKKWHPDRKVAGSSEDRYKMIVAVNLAYATLKDTDMRNDLFESKWKEEPEIAYSTKKPWKDPEHEGMKEGKMTSRKVQQENQGSFLLKTFAIGVAIVSVFLIFKFPLSHTVPRSEGNGATQDE